MCDFLESNGCRVDYEIWVPERLAACRAGAVTYGKNGFAYADPLGSFIIISAFVIDKELDYDEPTYEVKCPVPRQPPLHRFQSLGDTGQR